VSDPEKCREKGRPLSMEKCRTCNVSNCTMENDPEPAVVQEDTLVTRLAASSSVMEAEGGLTPRRRSARISRRLSGSEAPSPALTPSRSSRASKKTSQNLASKAISKAKVVADTIAEEQDIPPQSQEDSSSEKVENTNVNTPASEPDTKTLTKAPDSTSSEEMYVDPAKEATSGDRETEESSDGTVTSQTVPEGETNLANTDKQSPAEGEETPDSSEQQPVPEDKPSVADAPSPTPEVKDAKEAEKSLDKENNGLESPTAQKRSALDSSEKSEEARSPPKKMLLEKYNEENATVENSTPEVVETTEKAEQITTKKVEAKHKTKNPVVDRRAAHEEAMSRGRIKSGRFWKAPRDRFKSVVKSKEHRVDAKRRMEMKAEKLRVREMAKALEEDKKREAAEKRARREENEKRRDENARKNEVVQQIKNPAKIKRMKKKQLRMLAKRDFLASEAPSTNGVVQAHDNSVASLHVPQPQTSDGSLLRKGIRFESAEDFEAFKSGKKKGKKNKFKPENREDKDSFSQPPPEKRQKFDKDRLKQALTDTTRKPNAGQKTHNQTTQKAGSTEGLKLVDTAKAKLKASRFSYLNELLLRKDRM